MGKGILVFLLVALYSAGAAASVCGDGKRAGFEECDDGGVVSLDGCSSECEVETGYRCDTRAVPNECEIECPAEVVVSSKWYPECYVCPPELRGVSGDLMSLPRVRMAVDEFERWLVDAYSGASSGSISVALTHDQDLLWFRGIGYTDATQKHASAPTLDTTYRIASITKVFTAMLVLQLRDEGIIRSLDDPVTIIAPELHAIDPWATPRSAITWRQLLSHESGLPRDPECVFGEVVDDRVDWCAGVTYDDLVSRLNAWTLQTPTGQRPYYSNLAFDLVGRALERHVFAPLTYEQYITTHVLEPLGMAATVFDPTPQQLARLSRGYYVPVEYDNVDNPCGQLFSSTRDMVEFLKFLARRYSPAGPGQPLDGATVREWLKPGYLDIDGFMAWGMPWEILTYRGHILYTKAGDLDGYHSIIAFAPEMNIGFAYFSNNDYSVDYDVVITKLWKIFDTFDEALRDMQEAPALPPMPTDYIGTWSAGSDIVISFDGVYLHADSDAFEIGFVLEYLGAEQFRLVQYQARGASCSVVDICATTGQVWQFSRDNTGGVVLLSVQGFAVPLRREGAVHVRGNTTLAARRRYSRPLRKLSA